jgi:hypothetical protein
MAYSFFSRIRDILLLAALFFLVKTALEKTISFINEHKNSIVHELDRNFIDEIYTLQRQAHFIEENYGNDDKVIQTITDIKKQLIDIEEKYKTNSPGIMLLGPLGSAAIVTKEERLKKQLLDIANELYETLHHIHNEQEEFQPIENITLVLQNNKKLLKKITV